MKKMKTATEFQEISKQEFVIVDFYADWCGPCNSLNMVLEELEQERSDLEIISIDVDRFRSIAKEYGVISIPAIKVFSKGKVIKEKQGLLRKDELLSFIEE